MASGVTRSKGHLLRLLDTKALAVQFGGLRAVDGVDLAIDEGEILSLIGPNGAGKTTLFNLVSGFLRPTAGSVSFCDQQIVGLAPHAIAALGLVRTFQKTNIFADIPVSDSVATGFHLMCKASLGSILLRTRTARAEQEDVARRTAEVLAFTALAPLADQLGRNLSYGKQRILEIAVALAAKPRLLLLDEPASGLNPAETNELMTLIRRIRDGLRITILLIEHNMRLVVGISDRVTVLHHGRKIAEGTAEVVSRDPAVVEAYLGRGFTTGTAVHA
jgi:branched-chain amino acid transport system ATP-binding protein